MNTENLLSSLSSLQSLRCCPTCWCCLPFSPSPPSTWPTGSTRRTTWAPSSTGRWPWSWCLLVRISTGQQSLAVVRSDPAGLLEPSCVPSVSRGAFSLHWLLSGMSDPQLSSLRHSLIPGVDLVLRHRSLNHHLCPL